MELWRNDLYLLYPLGEHYGEHFVRPVYLFAERYSEHYSKHYGEYFVRPVYLFAERYGEHYSEHYGEHCGEHYGEHFVRPVYLFAERYSEHYSENVVRPLCLCMQLVNIMVNVMVWWTVW